MNMTRLYIESKLISKSEKAAASVKYQVCKNENDHWNSLIERCDGSRIFGGRASEMLTFGGDKYLMWVDIDSFNHKAVNEWLLTGPFPKNSFKAIPSTTGKVHIYVNLNEHLSCTKEYAMEEYLRETMPKSIADNLDQVRGHEGVSHIYLPYAAHAGKAIMPQDLMKEVKTKFIVPTNLRGSEHEEFIKRRLKDLIKSI